MKLKKPISIKVVTRPGHENDTKVTGTFEEDFEADLELAKLEGVVPLILIRNGCAYHWEIPYENFKSIKDEVKGMEVSFGDAELLALGGKLLAISPFGQYTIDFKQKMGVKKLDVLVFSSESEDRQLLHKIATEFRAKEKLLNRDS